MPFNFYTTLSLALCFCFSACTFSPAGAWATLEPSLSIVLDPPDGRRIEGDVFKSAQDFEVEIHEVGATIESLFFSLGEATTLAFDPASPPPGYGLCHNGHCHADDGRLVDYETISRALSGEVAAPELLIDIDQTLRFLVDEEQSLALECSDCELQKGILGAASATVSDVYLEVDVRDLRADPRCEARTLKVIMPLREKISVRIDQKVGPYQSAQLRVDLLAQLPIQLIDLDWCALNSSETDNGIVLSGELAENAAAKFRNDALLQARVTR